MWWWMFTTLPWWAGVCKQRQQITLLSVRQQNCSFSLGCCWQKIETFFHILNAGSLRSGSGGMTAVPGECEPRPLRGEETEPGDICVAVGIRTGLILFVYGIGRGPNWGRKFWTRSQIGHSSLWVAGSKEGVVRCRQAKQNECPHAKVQRLSTVFTEHSVQDMKVIVR